MATTPLDGMKDVHQIALEQQIRSAVENAATLAMAQANADAFVSGQPLTLRVTNVSLEVDIKWGSVADAMPVCPGEAVCHEACELCLEFKAHEVAKARRHNTASRHRRAGKSGAPDFRQRGGRHMPLCGRFKQCAAYRAFRKRSNERSRLSKAKAKAKAKRQPTHSKPLDSDEETLVMVE